jgi:hypothetical protein
MYSQRYITGTGRTRLRKTLVILAIGFGKVGGVGSDSSWPVGMFCC